jgi:hypothetical protein
MRRRVSTHQYLPRFTGQVGVGLFRVKGSASYWETHDKPGAGTVLDADRTAMGGHQAFDDVEANTCPVLFGAAKTDKSVKYPGPIGDWHPLTLIHHSDPRLATGGPNFDGDCSACRAVLDGIVDEVVENPMKFEKVSSHNGFAVLHETKRKRRMKYRQRFYCLAGQADEVKSLDIEPGHSLLNLSKVEELIQELDEPGSFVSYICDRFARRRIVGDRVQFSQYCRETSDSRKRSSHVMTHPHQEVEPLRQHLLNLSPSRTQPISPSKTPM